MASDPTFSSYRPLQAKQYAQSRKGYSLELYNHILKAHADHGGSFQRLLDVGCGPGNATRDLALAFDEALGLDPGQEMIKAARELGGTTKSGRQIQFEVCSAESCASAVTTPLGHTDMITAAMAAHWFDMEKFWEQAAKVLKPGGMVVLWTEASLYAHPKTPNVEEVNKILLHLERVILAPYEQPGNRLSRELYDDLLMPWTADHQQIAFPKALFKKDEWDRDGILTDEKDFFGGSSETSLDELERGLGTSSMVTRWREDHPDLTYTGRDCVTQTFRALRPLLKEQKLRAAGSTAILMFRKEA